MYCNKRTHICLQLPSPHIGTDSAAEEQMHSAMQMGGRHTIEIRITLASGPVTGVCTLLWFCVLILEFNLSYCDLVSLTTLWVS